MCLSVSVRQFTPVHVLLLQSGVVILPQPNLCHTVVLTIKREEGTMKVVLHALKEEWDLNIITTISIALLMCMAVYREDK